MRIALLFVIGLVMSGATMAQGTYNTVQDGDWDDPNTWEDQDVPSSYVNYWTEINITHEVTLSNDYLIIRKGEVNIEAGGQLTISGSQILETRPKGTLRITDGSLYKSGGWVKNNGKLYLTNAYFECHYLLQNQKKLISKMAVSMSLKARSSIILTTMSLVVMVMYRHPTAWSRILETGLME